ncbi:hypothetical protein MYAM1_000055 [Malassezia yamatoensis]|uniref:DAGKc domain-containing protein n=1 Tax=Malassezia yamatoensis TaxID=253288 RepID=A0AAJ6CFN8_9BASI|nr:hypothetical protein MYAM1_000055 [Malassezia yamatoensis]
MPWAVVWNGNAGDGQAKQFLDQDVRRYVEESLEKDHQQVTYFQTEADSGARRIAQRLCKEKGLRVVLLGGDGTVHEFLEGALQGGAHQLHPIQLVIFPTGTANALYASLYRPVVRAEDKDDWRWLAMHCANGAQSYPLTLMRIDSGDTRYACVVVSHALHAAILRDSESLRAEHPGLDRFKIAAAQNASCWWNARLILHRAPSRAVTRYDTDTDSFEEIKNGYEMTQQGDVIVDGPFAYMNAMVVERLEPTFVPAPFASGHCKPSLRRSNEELDVIVIRPTQSPILDRDASESQRSAFGHGPLTQVLFEGMYREGTHVKFKYNSDGSVTTHGDGPTVVEYFRASGYSWHANDDHASTTCIDGTVIQSRNVKVNALPQDAITVRANPPMAVS